MYRFSKENVEVITMRIKGDLERDPRGGAIDPYRRVCLFLGYCGGNSLQVWIFSVHCPLAYVLPISVKTSNQQLASKWLSCDQAEDERTFMALIITLQHINLPYTMWKGTRIAFIWPEPRIKLNAYYIFFLSIPVQGRASGWHKKGNGITCHSRGRQCPCQDLAPRDFVSDTFYCTGVG